MSFSNASSALIKATNKVFGTSVVYTYLAGGPTSTITGVFDNAFVEVQGFNTLKPVFRIRLADLTADPVEGDTLSINSVGYTVMNSQPDSFGASTLILEKT